MRKEPRQARSRALVADIVEAASREIGESGLANLTTNRVAARAGISIGSLYQYFGDKDSVVAAVSRAAAERLLATLAARMRDFGDHDMRATTRRVLTIVFDILETDPVHRELSRDFDMARSEPALATLETVMTEAMRVYLLRHRLQYKLADLPAALFVMVNSVHYTIARYLREPVPAISRDALIGSLTDMLAAYVEAAGEG